MRSFITMSMLLQEMDAEINAITDELNDVTRELSQRQLDGWDYLMAWLFGIAIDDELSGN